jgi:hypothetical protein
MRHTAPVKPAWRKGNDQPEVTSPVLATARNAGFSVLVDAQLCSLYWRSSISGFAEQFP